MAITKKKNSKKRTKKSTLVLTNFKIARKDLAILVARANRYENGNVSAWIRRAGVKYKPI